MDTLCQKCQQPLLHSSKFCAQCGYQNDSKEAIQVNALYLFLGALLSITISVIITGTGLYMLLSGISYRYSSNHNQIFQIVSFTFIAYVLHLLMVPFALSSWGHHNIKRGYNWGNVIFIALFLATVICLLYKYGLI